jgi:hypothetical protein
MNRFFLQVLLLSAVMLLMNACASHDEVTTQKPTGYVPGEKLSGEGVGATAGPGGAGANVRW